MENVFEKLTPDDLTPDLRMLASVCGLDLIKKMLLNFPGMNFYVPRITRLDNFLGKYMIANQMRPIKELARELSVSEQFIRTFYRNRIKSDKK